MSIDPRVDPIPIGYLVKKICTTCGGAGKVTQYPSSWIDENGNPCVATQVDCDECAGTGRIIWGEMVSE
jgi:DnaJ-class molecular chaperone